ncbi:MAG: hypothetical protein H7A46_21825 [Verrucomicrobiales bacterium]|nr:hypothetical protein [Verrucomicrobiales bacterium]
MKKKCSLIASRKTGSIALAVASLALAGVIPGPRADQMLFDFGADASITQPGAGGPTTYWNNITTVGTDPAGSLFGLVDTEGNTTLAWLYMIARFNGPNENGTLASTAYPTSATRDTLYGNTEEWQTLTGVFPEFILSGLTQGGTYNLTFYASRTGVSDNRETRYTVTGANTQSVDYDPANNIDAMVQVTGVVANDFTEIGIRLEPGPNNNNAYHFTYLGVLKLEDTATGQAWLFDFGSDASLTEAVEPEPETWWNNVTTTVGTDDAGVLTDLVTPDGSATGAGLEMVARFNGANTAGSTAATVYPTTATSDSLFGNTEAFSGLSDVFPEFKLTGLNPLAVYDFVFYGSRTATDNRETRYTVTGANSAFGDLNAGGNVDNTVQVTGLKPTAAGELTVNVGPGPNNNNANHFTYLGVMQVDWSQPFTPRILVDLGAAGTPSDAAAGVTDSWNNVTEAVGSTDDGVLADMVTVDGTPTAIGWQMVSRFNGANTNGTQDPAPYPVSATRDSLYGNTEEWGTLTDIFPVFKLTGLTPGAAYDLTFYASRVTGGADNRETQFTVTGATETVVYFNPVDNVDQSVSAMDVVPDAAGEITVALTPGPNNDNGYHFTYLGVLQLDWEQAPPADPATLSEAVFADGVFSFTLSGTVGATYRIQGSSTLDAWSDLQNVTLTGATETVEVNEPGSWQFYRAVNAQ